MLRPTSTSGGRRSTHPACCMPPTHTPPTKRRCIGTSSRQDAPARRPCRTTTGRSSANGGGSPSAVCRARRSSMWSSPARRARTPPWSSSFNSWVPRTNRCSTPCCSRSTSRPRQSGPRRRQRSPRRRRRRLDVDDHRRLTPGSAGDGGPADQRAQVVAGTRHTRSDRADRAFDDCGRLLVAEARRAASGRTPLDDRDRAVAADRPSPTSRRRRRRRRGSPPRPSGARAGGAVAGGGGHGRHTCAWRSRAATVEPAHHRGTAATNAAPADRSPGRDLRSHRRNRARRTPATPRARSGERVRRPRRCHLRQPPPHTATTDRPASTRTGCREPPAFLKRLDHHDV